jgi:hypothetical protein
VIFITFRKKRANPETFFIGVVIKGEMVESGYETTARKDVLLTDKMRTNVNVDKLMTRPHYTHMIMCDAQTQLREYIPQGHGKTCPCLLPEPADDYRIHCRIY